MQRNTTPAQFTRYARVIMAGALLGAQCGQDSASARIWRRKAHRTIAPANDTK